MVVPGRMIGQRVECPQHPDRADQSRHLHRAPRELRTRRSCDQPERDQRADQDRVTARVRPVVRARWVRTVIQRGHHDRRGDDTRRGHRDEHPSAPMTEPEAREDHQRPDEVELLFDRERPQVLHR